MKKYGVPVSDEAPSATGSAKITPRIVEYLTEKSLRSGPPASQGTTAARKAQPPSR